MPFADRLVMLAWGAPLALWLGAFFLAPLLLLVAMSFWTMENYQLSPTPTLANWTDFFSIPFYAAGYLRTLAYATTATAAGILLAFPMAFTLAFKLAPRWRLVAVLMLVAPFFSSYLVRTYAWRVVLANNGIVNAVLGRLGFGHVTVLDTPLGTLIGYLTYTFPILTLILFTSLASIDRSLIEASHNLGGARAATLFKVILPSARTGLCLAATFSFVLTFGDFIAPSLLGGGRPPTMSILIIDTVKSESNWPGAAVVAEVMIATLVAVTLVGFGLASRKSRGQP